MKTLYLYVVTNCVNWKQYVGITCDTKKRFRAHASGHGSLLVGKAVEKYGIENFKFSIICKGLEDYIKEMEIRAINIWVTQAPNGYNLSSGGEGGNTGVKYSEESRRKLSVSKKNPSDETRKRMSEAQRGKTCSLETRKRMGEAHKNPSDATRKKIGDARRGKLHSLETRERISKAHMGKISLRRGESPCAIPVTINGIKYACLQDAADALRVSYSTLKDAKHKAGSNNFDFMSKECFIDGIGYKNMSTASRATKISYSTMCRVRKKAGSNTFTFQPSGVLTPITSY